MASGWRYRVASVCGTAVLTAVAVTVINYPGIQNAFALVPYFGRPAPAVLSNGTLVWSILTTLVVTLAALWPVFKPRPRRILDTILLTQKRVVLSMIGLAALGYFNYSYRLPRATLMLTTAFLLVVLPLYTVAIRRRPQSTSRGIIVGDDPEAMADILAATDIPILGYVSPPSSFAVGSEPPAERVELSDGGTVESRLDALQSLGGLSRLDEVFVKHDIDTALLAFAETDRAEFFGTLDACAEHGVTAMVHRDHAEDVLTAGVGGGDLVEVDLEPWDWQNYVVKRTFDVAFAGLGLLIFSPVIALLAAVIKLDSPGPVLYSQDRTAEFGETFTVFKLRSMIPDAEAKSGAKLSEEDRGERDPRVTRVGRFIRRTHLDEIPQLWSILVGDMSVVGPRPERPELDVDMERGADEWRSRWFVKPGLTGLAQINDATGHDPQEKLRYDVEYIRRQSFWFDLKIVVRQIWQVLGDFVVTLRNRSR
jgi:lipopolysaccharide/colanic/teichoic acid biosynthesis glycosyltransferase